MTTTYRALVIIATLAMAATAHAGKLILTSDVQTGLQRAIADSNARAIAVGLYDNGEVQIMGFGRRGRDNNAVPQGDTVFEVGSISKVFTSLLTQTQVAAGRLSWDDTIASHLPNIDFASDEVAAITLRELSTHRSGLPRLPDNMNPSDPMNPYKGYDRGMLVTFLATYTPEELLKEYAYSNLGAGLLGIIAADAAGRDYAAAMQREVFEPLGLADTSLSLDEQRAKRLAQGFSGGADMPNWDGFDALAGAGAILSTTNDLLTFLQQNDELQVLGESLEAIRAPQATGETALGWHIAGGDEGEPLYWHNGGTGGYASFMAFRPATGIGVVILATSTEYGLITELGFAQMSGKTADKKLVDLSPYPGAYQVAKGFVLTVFIDSGQLVAQATGQGAFPLTPSDENEFVFPAADIRIVFELDDAGAAQKLILHQGGQVTPAPRVADEKGVAARQIIAVDAAQLADYVGEYQLAPAVVLSVLARDGQLFAQLTGQAAFPVFPYEADKFFYKVVDAQLHFERNDEGVIAVVLHQGGEQRAPRVK